MSNVKLPEIPEKIAQFVDRAERDCLEAFARVEAVERANTRKIIRAFQQERVFRQAFCAHDRIRV